MIFKKRFFLIFLILFFLAFTLECNALVTRPVDEIPGVTYPTQNPNVPTPTSRPKINKQPTPVKPISEPTVSKSPIFVPIESEVIVSDPAPHKGGSSVLKIAIFAVGGLILVGGLIFLYKTQMKG